MEKTNNNNKNEYANLILFSIYILENKKKIVCSVSLNKSPSPNYIYTFHFSKCLFKFQLDFF